MDNVFYLNGTKTLILRKENDKYITFNPDKLEFYHVNLIGAEILFLISKNLNKENIIKTMLSKYNVSKEVFENDMNKFLMSFGCFNIIKDNLNNLDFNIEKINNE